MFRNFGIFVLFASLLLVIIWKEKNPFVAGGPVGKRNNHCPSVKPLELFDIFKILGHWHVIEYYSSYEEALTYQCMRVNFNLTNGNMDMKMNLAYEYVDDPDKNPQSGNITWQIPNPMAPEHWRHIENIYEGVVYNTDVLDVDYENWLLILHCSDSAESDKKYLSSFMLGRRPALESYTVDYLREKIGHFDVELEYLFPVNQNQNVCK